MIFDIANWRFLLSKIRYYCEPATWYPTVWIDNLYWSSFSKPLYQEVPCFVRIAITRISSSCQKLRIAQHCSQPLYAWQTSSQIESNLILYKCNSNGSYFQLFLIISNLSPFNVFLDKLTSKLKKNNISTSRTYLIKLPNDMSTNRCNK